MHYPPLSACNGFDWTQIASIPIAECHAPLERLTGQLRLRLRPIYYQQGISGALPGIFLRAPVIERLNAALSLLPAAYGLEILDGWRPVAVQIALRESFRSRIITRHPEYTEAQIQTALDQFVANPSRRDMPPPHLTGGSVDLTLFDTATGNTLDMGTAFDEPSRRSYSSTLEAEAPSAAQQHRRILIHTRTAAGFTNLPSEWWHFDFGNQNWAFFGRRPHAVFGAAQPPRANRVQTA